MSMTAIRALVIVVLLVLAGGRSGYSQTVADVARSASSSVFQVVGEYGDGSGFLVDQNRGLVLTNAHVTAGNDSVGVKLDLDYKVSGFVVFEDRRSDVAIVAVNPSSVAGRLPLPPSLDAYGQAQVGDDVVVLGFPLRRGVITTRGIVSRRGEGTVLIDANVAPGNSGGPVLDLDGRVIAMTTFLAGRGTATGIGGALTAEAIMDAVGTLEDHELARLPLPDSLPVIPPDFYPMESLERAMWAEEWPDDLYDLSERSAVSGYDVRLMTPAYLARHQGEVSDLRYWSNEIAGYPPVATIRIRSQVGPTLLATLANFALMGASARSGMTFVPVGGPQVHNDLASVRVQGQDGSFIEPIQVKRSVSIVDGQRVPVVYLLFPAEVFVPREDGRAIVLNIINAEGESLPWLIEREVIEQVFNDFEVYLEERR